MKDNTWWVWALWGCWMLFCTHVLIRRWLKQRDTNRKARKDRGNTCSFKIPKGGTVTYDSGADTLSIAGGTIGNLNITNIAVTNGVLITQSQFGGGAVMANSLITAPPGGAAITLTGSGGPLVMGGTTLTGGTGIKIMGAPAGGGPVITGGVNFFGAEEQPDYDSLPREKAELPLVAWKNASIRYTKGLYLFQPLNTEFPRYDVEEDALCGHNSFHEDPNDFISCTCGFYALAKKPESSGWVTKPILCTLTVELSGLVLVCEQGYRATHQKVVKAVFNNECDHLGCALSPTGFGFGEDDCLRPYCDAHRAEQRHSLSVDDLEQILEIEVELNGL